MQYEFDKNKAMKKWSKPNKNIQGAEQVPKSIN